MSTSISSPLGACLALLAAWGLIGVAGLLRPRSVGFAGRWLFLLGALCSLALAVVAARSVVLPAEQLQLLIGLPGLPFHMRLDPLASVFLALLGAASAGISVFAAGYFRRGEGTLPGLLCLEYHVFLASMGLVILADDAYAFMVAWETMALASYFLVVNCQLPPCMTPKLSRMPMAPTWAINRYRKPARRISARRCWVTTRK